ncbi:MAG: hypothetical protein Q9M43_13530 [Sulfurimonas sp.]|nr:hypothetical protein [Sulfurimonas sp.]
MSWSNSEQKLVDISDSFFSEDTRLNDVLESITIGYVIYIDNFFQYLKNRIRTTSELEKFIRKIENLKITFHQKYLNLFSQNILEQIYHYEDASNEMWANYTTPISQDNFSKILIHA